MMRHKNINPQSGNVFLFILIGIALFAALAMVVSRGMSGQTTNTLSSRDAELAAVDIISYTQQVSRAVDRLRRRGTSENDISFTNVVVSGYAHGSPQPVSNQVFNSNGGNVSWRSPQTGVNDGSEWVFTGASCLADVGSGATGCDSDGNASTEELLMVLTAVDDAVCERINSKLEISGIPADSGGGASSAKFVGAYGDGTEITPASGSYETACVSRAGANYFYHVLVAR